MVEDVRRSGDVAKDLERGRDRGGRREMVDELGQEELLRGALENLGCVIFVGGLGLSGLSLGRLGGFPGGLL
jgi:hypothetical protein